MLWKLLGVGLEQTKAVNLYKVKFLSRNDKQYNLQQNLWVIEVCLSALIFSTKQYSLEPKAKKSREFNFFSSYWKWNSWLSSSSLSTIKHQRIYLPRGHVFRVCVVNCLSRFQNYDIWLVVWIDANLLDKRFSTLQHSPSEEELKIDQTKNYSNNCEWVSDYNGR